MSVPGADAVFDVVGAVLCADRPVRSLPELSLIGEHCRRHGRMYAALDRDRIDIARLRRALVSVWMPPRPTCCGRHFCASSTPSTPSGCSTKSSAGTSRYPATPPSRIGGPGCFSPPTPSCALLVSSPSTSGDYGRNSQHHNDLHPHVSVEAFGTSARKRHAPPEHRPLDPLDPPTTATNAPRPLRRAHHDHQRPKTIPTCRPTPPAKATKHQIRR